MLLFELNSSSLVDFSLFYPTVSPAHYLSSNYDASLHLPVTDVCTVSDVVCCLQGPCCWDDVLLPNRIHGICQSQDCDGKVAVRQQIYHIIIFIILHQPGV